MIVNHGTIMFSKIQGVFIHSLKEVHNMKKGKRIIAVVAIIALVVGLSYCKEGPMERAGKKVDKVVEDIKK